MSMLGCRGVVGRMRCISCHFLGKRGGRVRVGGVRGFEMGGGFGVLYGG